MGGGVAAWVDGQRRSVLKNGTQPQLSGTGHLIVARGTATQSDIAAVALDIRIGEAAGEPVSVFTIDGARQEFSFRLGRSGTLLYLAAQPSWSSSGRFSWLAPNLATRPRALADPPGARSSAGGILCPRVSPDGRSVAYSTHDATATQHRLQVVDLASGTSRTLAGKDLYWIAWSHDSRRIIYQERSEELGGYGLAWAPVDGSGPAERLTHSRGWQQPQFVTRDGRFLVYQETGGLGTSYPTEERHDLWVLPLSPRGEPYPLLRTPASERTPYLSPDQRWMAYVSDETGRDEIWVRPFPSGGAAIQVSEDGGTEPVWASDDTLYYRDTAGTRLFATPVAPGPVPQFGTPKVTSGLWVPVHTSGRMYDVMQEGPAFLMLTAPTYGRELNLVINFDEVIRRKMAEVKK
jgi:hypothetical protein